MTLLAGDEALTDGRHATATVLIVDDNRAKRIAVRAMLATLGLDIVEADSGRAALRAVLRQPVAVILMDVRMRGMDGYETAKLIREREEFALVPIIFVTAYGGDMEDSTTAYANGAVDFIFTPINADALRAKVSLFVDLFIKSQELQSSLESLTAVHAVLSEAEARTRAVLNSASDGIVTCDAHGQIEIFSASAERLFGYREAEMIGKPFEVIIAPDHRGDLPHADAPRGILSINGDDPAQATETVGVRKDGSTFPIEIGITNVVLDGRKFTVDCIRDITARKQYFKLEQERADAARREAERDRIAFDEAPTGSVIISPTGRIERVNKAMCRLTGYPSEELIGMLWSQLKHPDEQEDDCGDHTAGTRRLERRYVHRDDSVVEAIVFVNEIRDDERSSAHFFAQVQDVTQSRRASRELERAQFETLARLAAAAEAHDDTMGQHTRRVGELSSRIAVELGLPAADVKMIQFAAPLHDIGKLAVPDAILSKRGPLTAAEFEQVKTHCVSAERRCSPEASFPLIKLAEEIALTHHEKWDGSGYPAGLSGEAIPIAGRIVAVADVFDALTHTRPYKEAWSTAEAVSEMTSNSGRHFDPRVVAAFLSSAQTTAVGASATPERTSPTG